EGWRAGRRTCDGGVVNKLPTGERDVALVTTEYTLYPYLSAAENMGFGLKLRRTPQPEVERRVQAEARVLGVRRLLGRRARTLSSGERQRVAVGRATTRVPRLFLLDEPLAQLDTHVRAKLRAEFGRLQAGLGVTTLYTTHDQREAMALGHRMAVLDRGQLQQVAVPQQIYERPANTMVATFVGTPSMALIPVELDENGLSLRAGTLTLRMTDTQRRALREAGGRRWLLGLRAEHVTTVEDSTAAAGRRAELEVTGVEFLGALRLVTGALVGGDRATLTARVRVTNRARPGERLPVVVDLAAAHVFDRATGEAVLHGSPST
ncbi:MAG: ABC transporter ATP-binding protein, partial [Egibacteraceae bacterium]